MFKLGLKNFRRFTRLPAVSCHLSGAYLMRELRVLEPFFSLNVLIGKIGKISGGNRRKNDFEHHLDQYPRNAPVVAAIRKIPGSAPGTPY